LKQPEPTSLATIIGFNKENVKQFYDNVSEVLPRHPLGASKIWNMDNVNGTETKMVGIVASAERGELITVAVAVSARGTFMPPMLIFPKKHVRDHCIRDGPAGCIGAATGSGWMNEESFVQFMKHFIRHTKPTEDDLVLLFLDNHSSHLSSQALDFCTENGAILQFFPPHCSNHLQS
jgi:hypothetical protein